MRASARLVAGRPQAPAAPARVRRTTNPLHPRSRHGPAARSRTLPRQGAPLRREVLARRHGRLFHPNRDGDCARLRYVNIFTAEKIDISGRATSTSSNSRFPRTVTTWLTSTDEGGADTLNLLDLRAHQDSSAAAAGAGVVDSLSFDPDSKRLLFGLAAANPATRCVRARHRGQPARGLDREPSRGRWTGRNSWCRASRNFPPSTGWTENRARCLCICMSRRAPGRIPCSSCCTTGRMRSFGRASIPGSNTW